jgi:hypothetical protein
MTNLEAAALFTLISPVLLWPLFYYLFNIAADTTDRKVPPSPIYLVALVVGYIIDFWVNLTWGTALFFEWPNINRLTLSTRMDNLIVNGSGWRKIRAVFIVGKFLQPYDKTGQHTTHGA